MRRSRHSRTPITDEPVIYDQPTPLHREIFDILYWHRFLPVTWIAAHWPDKELSYTRKVCGFLQEEQNGYLYKPVELNPPYSNTRHGVYALTEKGAKAIGRELPHYSRHEIAHEFLGALHECSLKFDARRAGIEFSFFDAAAYDLPSGKWRPDVHPIVLGDGEVLIHSEIERRKYNESPKETEEKIDKAFEYVKTGRYKKDAKSALTLFHCSTPGRVETLKRYVERKYGKCSHMLFSHSRDWAHERHYPDPAIPLVPEWERVGYPTLKLEHFLKGGAE
jgi:hypothetical protein